MIILEMPEPTECAVSLAPATQSLRGGSPGAMLGPLEGRVSVGGPVYRRILPTSTDDVELRRFIEEATDFEFYLVHVTCTFRPPQDEPFTEALVSIDLRGPDGQKHTPIAWSIQPDLLYDAVEISRSVTLGPSLKIKGFGISADIEQGQKRQRKDIFLEALYELQSQPAWQLYRTDSTPLRGLQRFYLVVRAARDTVTSGALSLEAKVSRRRLGVFAYTASLQADAMPLTFAFGVDRA